REDAVGFFLEADAAPDQPRVPLAVAARAGPLEPAALALPRRRDPFARPGRRGAGRRPQLVLARPLDVDQQVHPVQQRAAQPALVPAQVGLATPAAVAHAGEP